MDTVLAPIVAAWALIGHAFVGAFRGVGIILEAAAMLALSHPVFVVGLVMWGAWQAFARRRRARA